MIARRLISGVFVSVSLLACGATTDQLRTRAAFDLQCDKAKLQVIPLDDRTSGVQGCGKQLTYVESCTHVGGYGEKSGCTWVLNTDSRQTKPAASQDAAQ